MFFTVFTPTYNRGYCLERVFNTLCSQTFCDFEWIVIDDGSIDNTRDLVTEWSNEASFFTIRYSFQPNSGKHIAWNKAVSIAKGDFFLCIDSDDEFVPDALEVMHRILVSSMYHGLSGIGVLSKNQYGVNVGKNFPVDNLICSINDMHFKYNCVDGEKTFCVKTSLLLDLPFPEVRGVSHFPEAWLWAKIPGTLIFVNKRIRIYHVGAIDQLTAKKVDKITLAHYLANVGTINSLSKYFCYDPKFFIKNYGCLFRFGKHLGFGFNKIISDIDGVFPKLLAIIMYPVGAIMYLRDKKDPSR